jgi:hypothetical protein
MDWSADDATYLAALHAAWTEFGDPRAIADVVEVSPHVSTNRVYRVGLDDGTSVISKFSSYGSFFLFREDHDRINRWKRLLYPTRYRSLLADSLTIDERVYTFYDGHTWAAFYEEVERRTSLPRILTPQQVACFGSEMALFHLECARLAPNIPLTSKSIKSDAIHLLEQVSEKHSAQKFSLDQRELDVIKRHTHEFLLELERVSYDYWQKIPVLIDWNLGNFSVDLQPDGRFKLFSRWDYDWFRIEPRLLDFYFLSRVSSRTGDRTHFTYSPHTLAEPRFIAFLQAYNTTFPLTETDIRFLRECYRFFILNYVVREGDHFFVEDLWRRLQKEAVHAYLPAVHELDLDPVVRAVLG